MAYVKTAWATGDVITAEKLNNMEGGIEAQDPIILLGVYDANDNTITFDISAAGMFSAIEDGKKLFCIIRKRELLPKHFLMFYLSAVLRTVLTDMSIRLEISISR